MGLLVSLYVVGHFVRYYVGFGLVGLLFFFSFTLSVFVLTGYLLKVSFFNSVTKDK